MEAGPAPSLLELLTATARELVESLAASGCAVSRVIGDVLVLVAEHTVDSRTLALGQGYLASDFPETTAMLADGVPRTLSLHDTDVDPHEAALLVELGYTALLMLPLAGEGEAWGLVEVYADGERRFSAGDVELAGRLLEGARAAVRQLEAPGWRGP